MFTDSWFKAQELLSKMSTRKTVAQASADLSFFLTQIFDLKTYVLTTFVDQGTLDQPYVIATGQNIDWHRHYQEEGYLVDDPVVARAKHTNMPFFWNDTLNDPGITKRGVRIIQEAREFKLNNGVFVPIYGPRGLEGSVAFGGQDLRCDTEISHILHLVSLYSYSHFSLLSHNKDNYKISTSSLTSRELECLKWVSSGKTSLEISIILSITKNTADWYLNSAIHKLGATSRAHAVAIAIRQGLLR